MIKKYILYGIFGTGVLAAYGQSLSAGVDAGSVATQRSTIPPEHLRSYQTAPIIWRTGHHGPTIPRATAPSYGSTRSNSRSTRRRNTVGGWGGFGGK